MIRTEQVIDCNEFDKLVKETYKRPYCLQQQDGCRERGSVCVEVPNDPCDYERDTIPEVVNGPEMGVSFKAWLARDPKQKLPDEKYDWAILMWWECNFYPNLFVVANDLHNRGLLPAGKYRIIIDW